MNTNRFTEFNPNDHVSTYIPLPVEFMAKALEAKQGQYDNALAQADAAEEAFKINAIDQHQKFKKQKQDEYNSKLTEISDYIVKTGDTSRAREIKSLANRWKNDADVNEMQMSKTQWDLDQAAILKATNDRVYNERNNPFIGFTGANSDGTMQGYRAKGVRPTKDYTAGADLAIDNIKANLDSTGEYVDQTKVLNTAMQVAPTFLMSENNQDFIDEAFGRQMPAYSQLTPELQAQLVPLAANYLAKRAAPQIFQKDIAVKDSSGSSSNNGDSTSKTGGYNVLLNTLQAADANGGKTLVQNIDTFSSMFNGQTVEVEDPKTKAKTRAVQVDLTGRDIVIAPKEFSSKNAQDFTENMNVLKNHNNYKAEVEPVDKKLKELKLKRSNLDENIFFKNEDFKVTDNGNTRQEVNPESLAYNYTESFREEFGIPKEVPLYLNGKTGAVFVGNKTTKGVRGPSSFDLLPKAVQDKYIKRMGEAPEAGDEDFSIQSTLVAGDENVKRRLLESAKSKTETALTIKQKALKQKYRDLGYDVDNKKTASKISEIQSSDMQKYADLNQIVTSLDGEYIIKPSMDKDNVIVDKNGNIYGNGRVVVTGSILEEKGVDYKKYKDIIKPVSGEGVSVGWDNDAEYSLPISIQSKGSAGEKVSSVQVGTFGNDAGTENNLESMSQDVDNYISNSKLKTSGKATLDIVDETLSKPNGYQNIMQEVSGYVNSLEEGPKQAYIKLVAEINAVADLKARNKEVRQLYLMLKNPDEFRAVFNTQNQQSNTNAVQQGKPKVGARK